jgi:hypothetical protein
MNAKRLLVGLAVVALATGSAAMANEIYKWTDENGDVHYGDRPSGSATEQRMALSYRRTNTGALQQRVKSHADSVAARQERKAEAAEAEQAAEEKAAEAAANAKKCDGYRAQLETFVTSRRLYREDENGERVYLDETQSQEARTRVENLISENCTS